MPHTQRLTLELQLLHLSSLTKSPHTGEANLEFSELVEEIKDLDGTCCLLSLFPS